MSYIKRFTEEQQRRGREENITGFFFPANADEEANKEARQLIIDSAELLVKLKVRPQRVTKICYLVAQIEYDKEHGAGAFEERFKVSYYDKVV